ncbi:hypothetical protein F5Y16DRAFT_403685 [Xylariaceae sp. FL0255]|nr:hypothetical protein F5Y16DRAFT_403685 [Xylariaceae sp. FL0255]
MSSDVSIIRLESQDIKRLLSGDLSPEVATVSRELDVRLGSSTAFLDKAFTAWSKSRPLLLTFDELQKIIRVGEECNKMKHVLSNVAEWLKNQYGTPVTERRLGYQNLIIEKAWRTARTQALMLEKSWEAVPTTEGGDKLANFSEGKAAYFAAIEDFPQAPAFYLGDGNFSQEKSD